MILRLAASLVCLASSFSLVAHADHQDESTVTARLVDVDSGAALEGATFIATEHNYHDPPGRILIPYGSSPMWFCVRSGMATASTSDATITLPAGETPHAVNSVFSKQAMDVIAYAPGYCLAQASEIGRGPRPWDVASPDGTRDGVHSEYLRGERRALLRTRRDPSTAEARIRYLQLALGRARACRDVESHADRASAMAVALQAEIDALRSTSPPPPPNAGRGFAIIPMEYSDSSIDWKQMNGAMCRPGAACGRMGHAGLATIGGPRSLSGKMKIVCRNPAQCEFDRRYANGKTALFTNIEMADAETTRMLLEAGADPNVLQEPAGDAGVDALLNRRDVPIDSTIRTLEVLVRDGRASVRERTAARFRPEPKERINASAESIDKTAQLRKLVMSMSIRPEIPVVCRPVPTADGTPSDE